jgi:hypothetical protein
VTSLVTPLSFQTIDSNIIIEEIPPWSNRNQYIVVPIKALLILAFLSTTSILVLAFL